MNHWYSLPKSWFVSLDDHSDFFYCNVNYDVKLLRGENSFHWYEIRDEIELFNSRNCKHIKMQSNLIWKQINKSTSNIHSFKQQNLLKKKNRLIFS